MCMQSQHDELLAHMKLTSMNHFVEFVSALLDHGR